MPLRTVHRPSSIVHGNEKAQAPVIGSIILVLIVIAGWLLSRLVFTSDVAFCREVLKGLATSDMQVISKIDWEHLSAVGVDVGATYRALPTPQDRLRYERTFVQKFSEGFRQSGGRLEAFRDWRLQAREGDRALVAVESEAKQKTLVFSVSAARPKKVEAIQWQ